MTVLVIDAGNTRLKWARVTGELLRKSGALAHGDGSADTHARRLFGRGARPERVLVSSVAGPQVRRSLERAARAARVPITFVKTPRRGGGITVGYLEPWRLGVDRYVGLVAAHHLFRRLPVLVVGVGTALTLDLVSSRGRHFGGAIVPSPTLMVESLLTETWGIRRRARGGAHRSRGPFGRSTRDAILEGSRYAAAALIDRAVEEAVAFTRRRPLVVLTGGGAAAVRPLLTAPCVTVPDLVLRGLAVLARGAPRAP